jgi:hypothetical protein
LTDPDRGDAAILALLTEYLGDAREPVAAAPDQPRILPDNK